MKFTSQQITIREALEAWGEWAREKLGTEIYRSSPGIDVKIYGVIRNISDEEAMHIDRGVAKLKVFDRKCHDYLVMHYIERMTTREIEINLKLGKGTVHRDLRNSQYFLSAELGYLINA